MAHVVIVEVGKDGKIELTKDELQKMLDDAYTRGHDEATRYQPITYPSNYPLCGKNDWTVTTLDTTLECTENTNSAKAVQL